MEKKMSTSIKDLPEHSRPREKLRERGATALSDAELIAVILGRGNRSSDVLTIASKVAEKISEKSESPDADSLTEIDGIGYAKAAQIICAFELARRRTEKKSLKVNKPGKILPLLSDIAEKKQEHFICISLNGANEIIEKRIVTVGLLNKCQVHPREVFADVLTDRAASVIFAHNHPSGELRPSKCDIEIQEQLVEAGKLLGINVLDHIIVSKNGYYSFHEDGMILHDT
jgi:DNA repair protein RadC